jgi:uncharacterized repeat protein (TIGR04138 family)
MSGFGTGTTAMVVPEGWTEAYAGLYRDGVAHFPPACLHYVLNIVRQASLVGSENDPVERIDLTGHETAHTRPAPRSVPPAGVIKAFRSAVRNDFGTLRDDVLEDWGLRTPADLGLAITLLGQAGALTLEEGDAPECYSPDVIPFVRDVS